MTGASSGIGRALTCWLAARGVHVYATARRADRLAALCDATAHLGARIEPVTLDVQDIDAVRARVRQIDQSCGGLDLIVANAGIGGHTDARSFNWTDFDRIVRTNVLGTAATLSAALPAMVARDRGHLVAIASLAAFRGLPRDAGYGASKAFLRSFTESLRVDLACTAVKVTCVYPGFVKSEMTAPNRFHMPFLLETDDAAARIGRAIFAGRAEVAFPWPLVAAVRALGLLPAGLYRRLAARIAPTLDRSTGD